LNRNGESRQSCLIPDFKRNSFSCSPFSMMLAVGLSYISFIMLMNFPSIPSFFRAFISAEFWHSLFLHLLRGSCGFCPCICLCTVLYLWIYECWTILASLELNW
jgi:hypothetical protein